MKSNTVVSDLESYLRDYVSLSESYYSLPLALWIIGTYCFESFDAYPYLTITSATKRSGKTRLSELIGFCSHKSMNISAMTGPTLFRAIELDKPTLICDEAEQLNSESAGIMRSVLNVGYRRGQTIPRAHGMGIKEFDTYCPKVFVLIGDTYDTLRDRSIVLNMVRGTPEKRFVYGTARQEAIGLQRAIQNALKGSKLEIEATFMNFPGLPFLTGRDEEIWTALFCIAMSFCPSRISELRSVAADLSTEKTAEARRYIQLEKGASETVDDEYATRLLKDLYSVMLATGRTIPSSAATNALKALPEGPWRKYRGSGLDERQMSHMLSRFAVRPVRVQVGTGRANRQQLRGYRFEDVEKAIRGL